MKSAGLVDVIFVLVYKNNNRRGIRDGIVAFSSTSKSQVHLRTLLLTNSDLFEQPLIKLEVKEEEGEREEKFNFKKSLLRITNERLEDSLFSNYRPLV